MNARTFGTDDRQAEFFSNYGATSYADAGQKILEAQRIAEAEKAGRAAARAHISAPAPKVTPRLASDKAVDYLVSLSARKTPHVEESVIRIWAAKTDRADVSRKIDELKAMADATRSTVQDAPKTNGSLERHNVPEGRYAVDGDEGHTVFVKVDRPTEGRWAGKIFVKIQAGDDLHRTSRTTADALLGKIAAAGTQEAMLRYGREIGSCGHCGRTLTNEESRAEGIGPICRGKLGW